MIIYNNRELLRGEAGQDRMRIVSLSVFVNRARERFTRPRALFMQVVDCFGPRETEAPGT